MARKTALLALSVVIIFVATALVVLRVLPAPLDDVDYLVAGGIATLVGMLALFVALVTTSYRSSDTFFKHRRKE